ncbi:hypothetical protein E2C01_011018 [Portunus trituberculatus]|uniref:Uncharacterized protein n=1 Tax=Portunus trituberculatus TaxID=210409 RepID=A0A5B7DA55_PORTR|nr:hypothetical protein [Portunus trituberculatus]
MSVCEEYGGAKQTVLDIRESKDKLVKYSAKYCLDASSSKNGKGGEHGIGHTSTHRFESHHIPR